MQRLGRLEDLDVEARLGERDCRRESTDSGANDERFGLQCNA
jgi:hypothetical protein